MTLKLKNVPFKSGQANGSGVGKYVFFIPADSLAAWPTITDNLEDAESESAYIGYTGDFTRKGDALWIKVYNTQGEGVVTSKPLGEKDSKMFTNELSYRFPKLTGPALVLANSVVNGDGVFVAWHDDAWRVIGDKHYSCDVNPDVTTGNSAGSSKGITFVASCPSHKIMPIYSGKIQYEPDEGDTDHDYYELDCATDEVTMHTPTTPGA